jgi:hypothetical protein
VGLILDSSMVIAAERQGQTAYQMLEAIGEQAWIRRWIRAHTRRSLRICLTLRLPRSTAMTRIGFTSGRYTTRKELAEKTEPAEP